MTDEMGDSKKPSFGLLAMLETGRQSSSPLESEGPGFTPPLFPSSVALGK